MKLSRAYWKPTLHRICSAVKQTIYYIQELACIYQRQDYGYFGWRKVPGGVQNTLYELWSCVCQRNWETTWDMIKRTLQRSQKHYRSLYQGKKTRKASICNKFAITDHICLRWGEIPTEPRLGQAVTYYWRQKPEVSPHEDLRLDVETSLKVSSLVV